MVEGMEITNSQHPSHTLPLHNKIIELSPKIQCDKTNTGDLLET